MNAGIASGPFVLSFESLAIALAAAIAAFAGWLAGRRDRVRVAEVVLEMVLAGLITARVAFVVQWFEGYAAQPWTAIDIRDGGFSAWPGIAGALAWGAWKARRAAPLRRPLGIGTAFGVVTWLLLAALPQPGASLPATPLETLDGARTSVPAIAAGSPAVVNLWATWCPPCMREMPVLSEAQARHGDVRFVFANQGEDPQAVRRFVASRFPALANVVIDRDSLLGGELGAPGLPTTFFYGAGGRLVTSHVGPLSAASLAAKLDEARKAAPH